MNQYTDAELRRLRYIKLAVTACFGLLVVGILLLAELFRRLP
jgi:hypothetical protein